MTVKEPVDRRRRHSLAPLILAGPLNLRDRQPPAGLRSLDKRCVQVLFMVFAEVLMA